MSETKKRSFKEIRQRMNKIIKRPPTAELTSPTQGTNAMKKTKRRQQKIITPTSKILRYMRMSRRISMREAGRRNEISDSAIAHYEQGRMDVSPARLRQLVESYGYAMIDFEEYAAGKPLPTLSIKDECFCLIERLDETKLRAVHAR